MPRRLSIGLAILVSGLLLAIGNTDSSRAARDGASPCAQASPTNQATPIVMSCDIAGTPVALGTPVTVDGLTITLAINSNQAGPVTMTVRVFDETKAPIADAVVVVKAKHLEMDMGVFPHDAISNQQGIYTAEWVGMGMGGNWQVEVEVTRPGHAPVAAIFLVTMQGLQ